MQKVQVSVSLKCLKDLEISAAQAAKIKGGTSDTTGGTTDTTDGTEIVIVDSIVS